jgi:hypothetical protein
LADNTERRTGDVGLGPPPQSLENAARGAGKEGSGTIRGVPSASRLPVPAPMARVPSPRRDGDAAAPLCHGLVRYRLG